LFGTFWRAEPARPTGVSLAVKAEKRSERSRAERSETAPANAGPAGSRRRARATIPFKTINARCHNGLNRRSQLTIAPSETRPRSSDRRHATTGRSERVRRYRRYVKRSVRRASQFERNCLKDWHLQLLQTSSERIEKGAQALQRHFPPSKVGSQPLHRHFGALGRRCNGCRRVLDRPERLRSVAAAFSTV
jgi:hypothetical protein